MMFKRDLEDLVVKRLFGLMKIKRSNLFTINKNFGFPFNIQHIMLQVFILSLLFGFKKGIIGKTDVLTLLIRLFLMK